MPLPRKLNITLAALSLSVASGYFPFTFVEQDKLQGFEVDVMNAGDDIEFVTIAPEREAKYVFTSPYVYDGAQVVVRAMTPLKVLRICPAKA